MPRDPYLHRLDLVSLLAGTVFVAVAMAYAIVRAAGGTFGAQWVVPGLFIGLGAVLASVGVRRLLSARDVPGPD